MTHTLSEPSGSVDSGLSPQSSFWTLANRQFVALLFVSVLVVSLIATTFYLVGRMGSRAAAKPTFPAARPQLAKAAPAATPSAPALTQPAAPKFPAVVQEAASQPQPGQAFHQVTATEKVMAAKVLGTLLEQKLPARIVDGPSPEIVRVVVGPIADSAQEQAWKTSIEKLGFKPFLRKY